MILCTHCEIIWTCPFNLCKHLLERIPARDLVYILNILGWCSWAGYLFALNRTTSSNNLAILKGKRSLPGYWTACRLWWQEPTQITMHTNHNAQSFTEVRVSYKWIWKSDFINVHGVCHTACRVVMMCVCLTSFLMLIYQSEDKLFHG